MRKTAFIFGAGASVGATVTADAMPSQRDLLSRAVSIDSADPMIRSAREIVTTYLREMYPGHRENLAMPFEEVIGPLEWLEARDSSFHIGGHTMCNMRTLAAFDTLLALVLNNPRYAQKKVITRNRREGAKAIAKERYDAFYARGPQSPNAYAVLLHKLQQIRQPFALVSFNYDLLLDRVLLHDSQASFIDYFLPIGNDVPRSGDEIPLVKPHGSLNWAWCSVCKRVGVFGTKIALTGAECKRCGRTVTQNTIDPSFPGTLRPILLRPSFLKTSEIAGAIWSRIIDAGSDMLAQCDDWIFVGYSFPLADSWVRAWLRIAEGQVSTTASTRRVLLVDPSSGATVDRYYAFFGHRFFHTQLTFWEFVQKLNTFDDLFATANSPEAKHKTMVPEIDRLRSLGRASNGKS